jgi:hypothetical protein
VAGVLIWLIDILLHTWLPTFGHLLTGEGAFPTEIGAVFELDIICS